MADAGGRVALVVRQIDWRIRILQDSMRTLMPKSVPSRLPKNALVRTLVFAVLVLTGATGTAAAQVAIARVIPLFTSATGPQQSFARIINHSDEPATVQIEGFDDHGARFGPITLALEAGQTRHFNSEDLETGNAGKGLPEGLGDGRGSWHLVLTSESNFEALAYMRTEDGFLTSIHDMAPALADHHRIATFNPGSNDRQVSVLRLVNPGNAPATLTIVGRDDDGGSPGEPVHLVLGARSSRTLTAQALESGDDLEGFLGDGAGKWMLNVQADRPIHAMSLLASPTGHLTNLSRVPGARNRFVPLFPATGESVQGFVRVVNHSEREGTVDILATDDAGERAPKVTLTIGAGQTRHFNSEDLEKGNEKKGLTGSTGAGSGSWRLTLESALDIEALAYTRTEGGFLTSMHDVAASLAGHHRVPVFNPGSNRDQVSHLRLINPGDDAAEVAITGTDDGGTESMAAVRLMVVAGESQTISAQMLETGEDFDGALGSGQGKWQIAVEADQPIHVMSLLSSPTGHLTNLSRGPTSIVTWTNDVAVLEPSEDRTYRAQDEIPLTLELRRDAAVIEISDENGDSVYRATDVTSPFSSSLNASAFVDGSNVMQLDARFVDGSSASTTFTVNVQKGPGPGATLVESTLLRVHAAGTEAIEDEIGLEVGERASFLAANEYSDEVVVSCTSDLGIESANEAIVAAQGSRIEARRAGTTRVSFSCEEETHRLSVTVVEPTLVALRIQPGAVVIEGVEGESEIQVTEIYSTGGGRRSERAETLPEDDRIVTVTGTTLTGVGAGRTSITATVDGVSARAEADVVEDLGGNRGTVTVRGGGILTDVQSLETGLVAASLVLRPETVSEDSEIGFEVLAPPGLDASGADEQAIVALDIMSDAAFARTGLVRIGNSFGLGEGALVSVSRRDEEKDRYERVGLATVTEDRIEVQVSSSGRYVMHAPHAATTPGRKATGGEQAGTPQVKATRAQSDCDIERAAPGMVRAKKQWSNVLIDGGSDLSPCDRSNAKSGYYELLRQYRPVLKVRGENGRTAGGEVPMRVSDLMRHGELKERKLGIDNTISYDPVKREELGEKEARDLLTRHDSDRVFLDLTTDDNPNWRDIKGIPTVYGRAAEATHEGKSFIVLQYWMYYAGSTIAGKEVLWHEGDVEFFQVVLDERERPVGASTGQHYYGESRHWREVEKHGGRPVIYIADGSHATHFSAQDAKTGEGSLGGFLTREGNAVARDRGLRSEDSLDKSTIAILPAVIEEPSESIFFQWEGHFGTDRFDADKLGRDGPPTPAHRGPDDSNGLSMFRLPVKYHFTWLMPGPDIAGFMEALARARLGRISGRDPVKARDVRMAGVLAGNDTRCAYEAAPLVFKDTPYDLSGVYQSVGKQNLAFQEYVEEKCLSGGRSASPSAIQNFFSMYFGSRHAACHYHGEYVSDAYRRYAVTGLDNYVDESFSLEELFAADEEATQACAAPPGATVADAEADEGDTLVFHVQLAEPPRRTVTYYYATYDGTAGTADYAARRATALTFRTGQTRREISIRTKEDGDKESTEDLRIYLADAGEKLGESEPADYVARATGIIVDDDAAAAPSLRIENARADEGEELQFRVSLDMPASHPVVHYYRAYEGSARSGDYRGPDGSSLIAFRAGQQRALIRVPTVDDRRREGNETLEVYLADTRNKLTGTHPSDYLARATGTIVDDDDRHVPSGGEVLEFDDEGSLVAMFVSFGDGDCQFRQVRQKVRVPEGKRWTSIQFGARGGDVVLLVDDREPPAKGGPRGFQCEDGYGQKFDADATYDWNRGTAIHGWEKDLEPGDTLHLALFSYEGGVEDYGITVDVEWEDVSVGPPIGEVFRDCADCPEMVVVPSGSFMMGSPPDEVGRLAREGPMHRVTIAAPFAVGVYEVTFDEWDACHRAGGCSHKPDDRDWGRGNRPVILVNWRDAQEYGVWLSEKTGQRYRLLSESEWEYVARAGTTTRYWWGDDIGHNRANCRGCGSLWDGEQTAPVGSFSPNAFGLHDVHGNVWEWVEDCWHRDYEGAPSDGSAWTSGGNCGMREFRGGSLNLSPGSIRSANRNGNSTKKRYVDLGFRVARTLTP